MKFDIEVTEQRINATSTLNIDGAEIRVNLNFPWALLGATQPQVTAPSTQTTLPIAQETVVTENVNG